MLCSHRYYERRGRFAEAENGLFDLLERLRTAGEDAQGEEVVEAGRAFYERLLKLDDHTLIDGNLPRAEIVDAVRELQIFMKK